MLVARCSSIAIAILNMTGWWKTSGPCWRGRGKPGIDGFLNISTRRSEWEKVVATAAREPDVWASVGIHPHEADAHADLGAAALMAATEHPKVIGIGETGLDYFYDKSERDMQRRLFRMHIAVARETGLAAHHPYARC